MEWRTFTSTAFMPAESWRESGREEATTKDITNIPLKSIRRGMWNRRKMCRGLMWLGN